MAESIDMDEMGNEEMQSRIDRGDFVEGSEDYEDADEELNPLDEEEEDEDLDEEDEEEDLENEDEDPDSESEEEEDGEEELEEDEEPINIPKGRFDEVNEAKKELAARNKWLEEQVEKLLAAQQAPATTPKAEPTPRPEVDYDDLEDRLAQAMLEDNKYEASKIRSELKKAREADLDWRMDQVRQEMLNETKQLTATQIEDQRVETLVETYETQYPFLDKESDDSNPEAIEMVNTLINGHMASGKSRSQSLKLAVKKVAPLYKNQSEVPAKAPKAKVSKRKTQAAKRNVKARKQQAPKGNRSSSVRDSETFDAVKMPSAKWRKLSEREKAIARGDVV